MTGVEPVPVPCVIPRCRGRATVGRVCGTHHANLAFKIIAIPDLFARLDPSPKTVVTDSLPQKPAFESKSPADDYAIMLRDARSVGGPIWIMQQWQIAFWIEKSGVTIVPETEIKVLTSRLALHWDYWTKSSRVVEFHDSLTHIHDTLSLAVGLIARKSPIGLCKCKNELFAVDRVGDDIICPNCGHRDSKLVEKAVRKAYLTYATADAPFWRKLVNGS